MATLLEFWYPQISIISKIIKPTPQLSCGIYHSRASKILIRNQSLLMRPLWDQRAMLGGPEFVFWEILANGGDQKKSKN